MNILEYLGEHDLDPPRGCTTSITNYPPPEKNPLYIPDCTISELQRFVTHPLILSILRAVKLHVCILPIENFFSQIQSHIYVWNVYTCIANAHILYASKQFQLFEGLFKISHDWCSNYT